jgi:hypothetical protein
VEAVIEEQAPARQIVSSGMIWQVMLDILMDLS